MLLWEIHISLWVFGILLRVTANIMKFWVINMLCQIISMLLWVISVLLLNSSEVYPSALFTLNICHESRRSAAWLQSSLPSFPKITHDCIAVDLSGKFSSNQLIASSFVDKPPTESHSSCYNEEFMCRSEWLECLSWSYTGFFSSARHNFYIYHYSSHRQHCWRVTSLLLQCFVDLNLNQKRLGQDAGLGSPVGGPRTIFIKFKMIIF